MTTTTPAPTETDTWGLPQHHWTVYGRELPDGSIDLTLDDYPSDDTVWLPESDEWVGVGYADDDAVSRDTRIGLAIQRAITGPTGADILDALEAILYPDGPDTEWNGGDVCEAVASLLDTYRPNHRGTATGV